MKKNFRYLILYLVRTRVKKIHEDATNNASVLATGLWTRHANNFDISDFYATTKFNLCICNLYINNNAPNWGAQHYSNTNNNILIQ